MHALGKTGLSSDLCWPPGSGNTGTTRQESGGGGEGRDAVACEGRMCVCATGAPAGRSAHADVHGEAAVSFSNTLSLFTAFCCRSGELASPAPSFFSSLLHPARALQLSSMLSHRAAVAGIPLPLVLLRLCFRV